MLPLAAAFVVLLAGTLRAEGAWEALQAKPRRDWIIDLSNLFVQGTLIPLLELTVFVAVLLVTAPELQGSVAIPLWAGFLLNVMGVDYLYYWNHRILHRDALWPIHRVHHSVTHMDVFATSRNTLWTSVVIVYLWVNGLMLYLLADPTGFAAGAAATAIGDLWRHSRVEPPDWLSRWLRDWLVLPSAHARHHGASVPRGNYAANFRLWDLMHGTALPHGAPDEPLGYPTPLPLGRTLLWPYP